MWGEQSDRLVRVQTPESRKRNETGVNSKKGVHLHSKMAVPVKYGEGGECGFVLIDGHVGNETIVRDMDRFRESGLSEGQEELRDETMCQLTDPDECNMTPGLLDSCSGVRTAMNGLT